MTPLEILFAVRGLLAQHDRWTKGALARNVEGRKVSITHPHACQFSLEGAFFRVAHITKAHVGPVHATLQRMVRPTTLEFFNNAQGTTHWTILQLLDRAIREFGGEPPVDEPEE